MVTVKRLSSESRQGKHQFVNEVAIISTAQRRNLAKLHGCVVEIERLRVYKYLENNSLAKALLDNKKSHLQWDWPTRYKICIGTT